MTMGRVGGRERRRGRQDEEVEASLLLLLLLLLPLLLFEALLLLFFSSTGSRRMSPQRSNRDEKEGKRAATRTVTEAPREWPMSTTFFLFFLCLEVMPC
jgi:hypothetical protein